MAQKIPLCIRDECNSPRCRQVAWQSGRFSGRHGKWPKLVRVFGVVGHLLCLPGKRPQSQCHADRGTHRQLSAADSDFFWGWCCVDYKSASERMRARRMEHERAKASKMNAARASECERANASKMNGRQCKNHHQRARQPNKWRASGRAETPSPRGRVPEGTATNAGFTPRADGAREGATTAPQSRTPNIRQWPATARAWYRPTCDDRRCYCEGKGCGRKVAERAHVARRHRDDGRPCRRG